VSCLGDSDRTTSCYANLLFTCLWLLGKYKLRDNRPMTLCELVSLNMGGLSSNPIRCANQDNERKDLGRGIGPKGNSERKKPFKNKCDGGMNLGLLHGLWCH
jgi:hypothetical protein